MCCDCYCSSVVKVNLLASPRKALLSSARRSAVWFLLLWFGGCYFVGGVPMYFRMSHLQQAYHQSKWSTCNYHHNNSNYYRRNDNNYNNKLNQYKPSRKCHLLCKHNHQKIPTLQTHQLRYGGTMCCNNKR